VYCHGVGKGWLSRLKKECPMKELYIVHVLKDNDEKDTDLENVMDWELEGGSWKSGIIL
jgi:hypothetical protein